MNKFELLAFNHTAQHNQNFNFSSIEELKQQLAGIEYTVNGGLLFNDRFVAVRDYTSLENLEAIVNFLNEEPNTTNEKLIVIYDLMNDFSFDFESACSYFDDYFFTVLTDIEEFGREYAEYKGFEIPEHIEPYFDYERYGMSNVLNFKRIDNHLFHYTV